MSGSRQQSWDVVVVGSANIDQVAVVPHLPQSGETVLTDRYEEFCGGKGANQAISAARLGRRVSLIGRTGSDPAGNALRDCLVSEGVDVGEFKQLPGISSGRALVVVNQEAENSIVVVGGANNAFRPEHVAEAASRIAGAVVVVAQLEVPEETVKAAASLATGHFILNPAPASMLQDDLLALVDVLVVNEIEFSTLYGQAVPDSRTHMTSLLRDRGLDADVIITRGARGALLWHDGGISYFKPPAVEVVDSTGAGDAFVGALADALSRGLPLVEATRWAVCAASISTSALGATTAMPGSEAVQKLVSTVSVEHDPPRRTRTVKMSDVRSANRGA